MKKLLAAVLLLAIAISPAWSATLITDGSTGDINTKIGSAAAGDTVVVPVGNFTWNATVNVTKAITLQGAGKANTFITNVMSGRPAGASKNAIKIDGTSISSGFPRITGFTFYKSPSDVATSGSDIPWISAGGITHQFKIDHCDFELNPNPAPDPVTGKITPVGTNIFKTDSTTSEIWGLFDHCIFSKYIRGEALIDDEVTWKPPGLSSTPTNGDGSWADDSYQGTEKMVYYEDCLIDIQVFSTDALNGGGRACVRYCRLDGTPGCHGADTGNSRGGRHFEYYHNIVVASGGQRPTPFLYRAGSGVVYDNRVTNFKELLKLNNYRMNIKSSVAGCMDGANPWDLNSTGDVSTAAGTVHAVATDNFSTTGHGDIYAQGIYHGPAVALGSGAAINLASPTTGYATNAGTLLGNNVWAGFSLRSPNAAITGQRINASTSTTVTVDGVPPGTSGTKQFTLNDGDPWEIRHVDVGLDSPGRGKGDLLQDTKNNLGINTRTGVQSWPNQAAEGVWCWGNKIRTSASPTASWLSADVFNAPGVTNDGGFQIKSGREVTIGSQPAGFPTTSISAGDYHQRIGPDAEVYALAGRTNDAYQPGDSLASGSTTYYGYTYPHPLTVTGPQINSAPIATFSEGNAGSFQVATSGFSGTPTFSKTGSLPSAVTLSSSGLLSGTPATATAGNYDIVITASQTTPTSQSATQNFRLVVSGSNQPPTVSLTAPAAGATFLTTDTITFAATASDPDGSISKVEFYDGATLLGTDTVPPYTFSWTGATAGSHSLTAKAYDNNNVVTQSSPAVTITVNASGAPPPPADIFVGP